MEVQGLNTAAFDVLCTIFKVLCDNRNEDEEREWGNTLWRTPRYKITFLRGVNRFWKKAFDSVFRGQKWELMLAVNQGRVESM